jgi:hypothetical protein
MQSRGVVQKKILAVGIVLFIGVFFCGLQAQDRKSAKRSTSAPVPAPPTAATSSPNSRSSAPIDPQFGQERNAQPDPDEVKREKQREKALNKDRYESLKKDTDKLLDLATELKKSVDETTENKLSLEVIRKTDEIEKLAKKVRDKMKSY